MTETIVIQTPKIKVVEVAHNEAELIKEVEIKIVEVGIGGPQGPKGDRGDDGTGIPGPPGFTYVHTQGVASTSWVIVHNLGGFPNITVVDSANSQIEGEVIYDSADQITVNFSAPFGGRAFLT